VWTLVTFGMLLSRTRWVNVPVAFWRYQTTRSAPVSAAATSTSPSLSRSAGERSATAVAPEVTMF